MTQLTAKQIAYIQARAEGLNQTKSAIAAGYSPAGANRQASAMEKLPKIKAAIAKAKRARRKGDATTRDHIESIVGVPAGDDQPRMKAKYTDSLSLLQHTYNNPRMPDSIRLRAAEQALPYEHGRVGEKGKKEAAKDRARDITEGTNTKRGKFAPVGAPKLGVIDGGRK